MKGSSKFITTAKIGVKAANGGYESYDQQTEQALPFFTRITDAV